MVSSCGCSVRETLPEIGHARVSPMIGGYVIESLDVDQALSQKPNVEQ